MGRARPEPPPSFARFRVVRELGSGAQGAVHEAIDLERNARVALKTLRQFGPDEIVHLKAEFRAVRDLRHPNLVRLGELIEDAGRWLFTMEAIEGVDFLAYVRGETARHDATSSPTRVERKAVPASGPSAATDAAPPVSGTRLGPRFDEGRLRSALAQLASALAFLHRAGKAHCDLKPSNVLVDRGGRVVLIDFGIVAELSAPAADDRAIAGTVAYMAPEQVLGEGVGPASDWYAAGVLLFEALTGRRPFEGADRDVMERKCVLDAPSPRELALDLPADLEALCARMLARDAERRPADDEVLRSLGVTGEGADAARLDARAPFVGREREMLALEGALARVRDGEPAVVFVEGESGVGKSSLVRRFIERTRDADRDVVVLEGRCHEQERVPYNAFDAVIDALARHLRAQSAPTREALIPPGMDRICRSFPSLGVVAQAERAPEDAIGGRTGRNEAFAALRELLRRVGERRALVVLIEDIHWADADSLSLIEALTEPPGAPRMLLLGTARAREGDAACAAVRSARAGAERVTVHGLATREAEELVRRLLEGRSADAAIDAAAVVESSRGHPMFIEELVGYLERHAARGHDVALDEALAARAAQLDPEARALLEVVAAAASPTAQSVVAAAAGMSFDRYAAHAASLRAAKLLRLHGQRRDDAVEPYHDRVRQAVYAGMDARTREAVHAALGAELEARAAGPEILFRHFDAANDRARASRYAETAGAAAARALAFDRACALYERALALGEGDVDRRRRLLAGLAESLADAGRPRDAGERFLEAARTGEPPMAERHELLRRGAEHLMASGNLEPGLAATRIVLSAGSLSFPRSRLVALARLGWHQWRLARHPLTWTVRPAGSVDRREAARIDLCWSVGAGLGLIDSVRSILFLEQGALLALAHGDEARIARALAAVAIGEAGLGRRGSAARLRDACGRAAASDGSARALFYAKLAALAHRFFLDNDWHGCLVEARDASELWRACGRSEGWEADVVEQFVCWSLDNIGRVRELRERVPAKIRAAVRAGNRFIEVNFRTQFVNLALADDRPDDARREVEEAIASWPRVDPEFGNQDYLAVRNLTYVALYAGDVEEAVRLLPEWRRYFASLIARVAFLRQDALWWVASIALERARRMRRGERERDRCVRNAKAAMGELERLDLPMAQASAVHLRAAVAALEGDEGAAREALRDALRRAEERGTELYAECIRARLAGLVGGDEGRALREASDASMAAQGVLAPQRLVAATLPGWPEA